MIEQVTSLAPDPARGARTAARCRDVLAARRRKMEARTRPPGRSAAGAERLLLMGGCMMYLVSMAENLLRIATP
ncbi:MAG: hypothetical protein AB7P99_15405 [Vicinamibacterales bacterium]